jgi:hypothetical protein
VKDLFDSLKPSTSPAHVLEQCPENSERTHVMRFSPRPASHKKSSNHRRNGSEREMLINAISPEEESNDDLNWNAMGKRLKVLVAEPSAIWRIEMEF